MAESAAGTPGLTPLTTDLPHHGDHRHRLLERLADAFEQHVELAQLLES